jgi:hypothetical protein
MGLALRQGTSSLSCFMHSTQTLPLSHQVVYSCGPSHMGRVWLLGSEEVGKQTGSELDFFTR